MPPASGLRGRGTLPGSPAGSPGLKGWDQCPPLFSCSSGPACLSCSPLASLLWPQDLCGRGWGTRPGSSVGYLGSSGWGKHLPVLSHSSGPRGGPFLSTSMLLLLLIILFYFIYFIFGCVGSLLLHAGFL